jgi:arabinogalactan endo-1,4-beta-galactosidase
MTLASPRFCRLWRHLRLALVLGASVVGVGVSSGDEFLHGADVSALATFEHHGAAYRRGGRRGDALEILRAEGIDCFRLRLFVAPDGRGVVTNDLAYTLALARRVKRSGARLILDLHYSDTWADPGKQFKPKAWSQLAFPALVTAVRDYTHEVMAAFVRAGVAPDYVQLGNEITNGLLWPDGRVEFGKREDTAAWGRLGQLLGAAHAGFAAAFPSGARPKIILQVESPHQLDRAVWFCRQATDAGVPFDWIGVSYYPEWHGGLDGLRTALTTLARDFHKPVLVVETAYPWKPDEHWTGKPNLTWPLSPRGQRDFLHDLVRVVREVPDGLGAGVCYWHPESVPAGNLQVWVGGSCALFDDRGNLLPAAGALGARR